MVKRLLKTGALRQLAGILGAMVFVRYGALGPPSQFSAPLLTEGRPVAEMLRHVRGCSCTLRQLRM